MKLLNPVILLAMVLLGSTLMYSCNKKGCTDPEAVNFDVDAKKGCDDCCEYLAPDTTDRTPTLKMVFRNYVGPASLSLGNQYFVHDRAVTFSQMRYYISGIELYKADGATKTYDDYLLVTPDNNNFGLGKIDTGVYEGFSFHVGVDSATNHADPSVYPLGHPLSLHSESMHWGWNTGYIFMKMEGLVDTSTVQDSIPDYQWVAHLGTDDLFREVTINREFEADLGVDLVLNIELDLQTLFENVDLGDTDLSTETLGNKPLALKYADQIPEAFGLDRHQ